MDPPPSLPAKGRLPEPEGFPVLGHLPRWGAEPLELLTEGARLGPVFGLRLGVRAAVGASPAWNRLVLGDLDTFRSRGGFSGLVPYLAGGVILTDAPAHKTRRAELNRPYHKGSLETLRSRVRAALEQVAPRGDFEAGAWASRAVLAALNAAFFSGRFPEGLLHDFLAPLHRPFPAPLAPRPLLFGRMNRALSAELRRRAEGGDDLAAHLAAMPGGLEELRISLAAGYDTTAHTLAWSLWHAALHPGWAGEGRALLVKETLRLYPPGFAGSRRAARGFTFGGFEFPAGGLVLYSPYLTHRNPELWPEPLAFRPERFLAPPPAWGYLPFGGGERTCLGMHLAGLMLEEALGVALERGLVALRGDPSPKPGLTLAPRGELWLRA